MTSLRHVPPAPSPVRVGRVRRPTRALRLVVLGCLAFSFPVLLALGWGAPAMWAPTTLAAAVGAADLLGDRITIGPQRWPVSLRGAGIAAALTLQPGAWLAFSVVVGALLAQVARRQTKLKTAFAAAESCATTTAALLVAHVATGGGRTVAAATGMAAAWAGERLLRAVAVRCTAARPLGTLLRSGLRLSAAQALVVTVVGLLGAWLSLHAPLGLLALVVPALLLWSSHTQQVRREEEVRLFAELSRSQERATGRSVDVSVYVLLTAAARLFGGADVQMVLLTSEGAIRYTGDEFGVPERRRVDPSVFDEPWLMRSLGEGGISSGIADGRPWCSALLGPRDAPLAVLHARRPLGSAAFGRREAMLVRVLVSQAEAWLSVADLTAERDAAVGAASLAEGSARALGDLGAHTAPALAVLRDSASRLVRLSDLRSADPIGEIVEELHSVERAVASLLGAIALAAEPDLAHLSVSLERPLRAPTEWTTTGVLT